MSQHVEYIARLHDFVRRLQDAYEMFPASAAALAEVPLMDSAKLRERDLYEAIVLASKLPRTLLGRAPGRPGGTR